MHGLQIKYGLGDGEPTAAQAKRWAIRTNELIAQGKSAESAGEQAAKEIFASYRRYHYAGQVDTIYDLLQALGKS